MRHKQRTDTQQGATNLHPARHGPLADLATLQHGVVSSRQLAELGYLRGAITRAAASGRLHRLQRGVYAVGHKNLTERSRHMAAVLACAPDAVLSHYSAGWLWGLLRYPGQTIHLTAPTRRHPKHSFCLHYAALTEADLDSCEAIPATAVPRTMLDLAAVLPAGRLDRVVERCEELRLLDLGPIESLLERAGHHRGRSPLLRALALYRPSAFVRSQLERRFLELVLDAGLSAPAMNYNLAGYELDAYWEAERFVVELDVYETHGSRAAFERDRLRQEELKLIGIELIRVTGPRLDREPKVVMDRLATLLTQRRHASS